MELITGKNKEQFYKWYKEKFVEPFEEDYDVAQIDGFTFPYLPLEMQIGVYLAYYDSLGILIDVDTWDDGSFTVVIFDNENGYDLETLFKTRNEAYKEAFKKADEIINQLPK